MAGFGFQINAFQANAFQEGYSLVASDYSVASPTFGTPALGQVLHANNYSTGSPDFATPTAHSPTVIHAANYSTGSPTFATPSLRQNHMFAAGSFATGAPTYDTPILRQNHHLYVAPPGMAVGSPTYGTPLLRITHVLSPNSFSVGSPIFATPGPLRIVGHIVMAGTYDLESPKFARPRLTVTITEPRFPPLYLSRVNHAEDALNGLLDKLLGSIPLPHIGGKVFTLLALVGTLRVDAQKVLRNGTLGTRLQECFDAAYEAGPTFNGLETLRKYLMGLDTREDFTRAVVQGGLLMTVAQQSKIVPTMTFKSRTDISEMIDRVRNIFDDIKTLALDDLDETIYQTFNALGRSTLFFLADTELQLPRVVTWRARDSFPSLYLAQRIYADASRYEEISDENKTPNPAFMPPGDLKVLSD